MTIQDEKLAIVNADDFGWSQAVTDGIVAGHKTGVVTSTTLVSNMPAADYALSLAKDLPELGVGVHLNVTQGRPLSKEGQALAGEDGLMNHTAIGLIAACTLKPWLISAVAAECQAQICWAMDHGLHPTHLDSHRHSHAFTPIFLRVVALAKRYHIPFVRRHREKLPPGGWATPPAKQKRTRTILNCFGAVNYMLRPGMFGTVGTIGVAHTGFIDEAWMIRAASAIVPGATEIMVHPGYVDGQDPAATRLKESRKMELDAVCSVAAKEAFRENGVRLVHYGTLR